MKTISINELKEILGYADLRAARKWCIDKKVLIIKQGKAEFVFETNFKEAFELPFVIKLKKVFGDKWEAVYRLYEEGNIPALYILNDLTTIPVNFFKPKSNNKSKFIKKLEDYERKKKNAA